MLKPSDTPNPLLQSFDVIEKRKEKDKGIRQLGNPKP
jgi:hypothetical protein